MDVYLLFPAGIWVPDNGDGYYTGDGVGVRKLHIPRFYLNTFGCTGEAVDRYINNFIL